MTLKGLWVAQYTGSNTGTAVIDLDEYDSFFAGTAVAWDNNPAMPSSGVRIVTPSKSVTHNLKAVPVTPLDFNGNNLTPQALQELQNARHQDARDRRYRRSTDWYLSVDEMEYVDWHLWVGCRHSIKDTGWRAFRFSAHANTRVAWL